eukprot:gene20237-28636_t
MNRPATMLAQTVIPNETYSFALKIRDYRLLWAINCGSCSNLPYAPIYTPEMLGNQLDGMM